MAIVRFKPYRISFGIAPVVERPEAVPVWQWQEERVRELIAIVAKSPKGSFGKMFLLANRGEEGTPIRVGAQHGHFTLSALVLRDGTPEQVLDACDDFFAPHGWRVVR